MSERRSVARAITIVWMVGVSGCGPRQAAPQLETKLELTPKPARVGVATVALALADAAHQPLTGAAVELEGNMNHAGMQPVFSKLNETAPGRYSGTLELTMAGDWVVLVTARKPGAAPLLAQIPVKGVLPK